MSENFKKTLISLAVLLILCLLPWVAASKAAATENSFPASTEKVYTGEIVSLDFQNAELQNVIRTIGEVAGKKIIISEAVNGKVTIKLKDVPWDQALDIILASRNLGIEKSGDVLTVYDLPTLWRIQAERKKNEQIAREKKALVKPVKKVFTPKYVSIDQVKAELEKVKNPQGRVEVIGNDIYVEDQPGTISTMAKVFMRVDRLPQQILVEARIIESSAALTERLNFQNLSKLHGAKPAAGADGTIAQGAGEAKIGFVVLNKTDLKLLNDAIESEEDSGGVSTRTIAAPRILAANDQEVTITQSPQKRLYRNGASSKISRMRFYETFMKLKVKPHANEYDQTVFLDITLTTETSGPEEPKEAAAQIRIKEGETIAIGSILVGPSTKSEAGISAEHTLPLTDWLYNNCSPDENQDSELFIILTANEIPINI